MEKIKEFFNKLFSNPISKRIAIITGVFILIIILIIIIVKIKGNNRIYTYEELESKIVSLTKERYATEKYKSKLPQNDKDVIEVPLQSFVDDGTFKDIQSLTAKQSVCTGYVKIINNYGNYLYIPYLDCGKDYKSTTIYDVLTREDNIVTSGNGLYMVGNEYIYKGDNVNNYLSLNGILYRILRINEDGTIRVLELNNENKNIIEWDNRYNEEAGTYSGKNDYINSNNINSRIKDYIEYLYSNDKLYNSNNIKAYFVNKPLCTGKRSVNDDVFNSSIECSKQEISFPFGMLMVNEFFLASLDKNCKSFDSISCSNYNYFSELGKTWTITADKDSTYKAYRVDGFSVELVSTDSSNLVSIVTTFNKDLLFKEGKGTEINPFIIKYY